MALIGALTCRRHDVPQSLSEPTTGASGVMDGSSRVVAVVVWQRGPELLALYTGARKRSSSSDGTPDFPFVEPSKRRPSSFSNRKSFWTFGLAFRARASHHDDAALD